MGLFLIYGALGAFVSTICLGTNGGRFMAALCGFVVAGTIGYAFMPTLNWGYLGIICFLVFLSFIGFIIALGESDETNGGKSASRALFVTGALIVIPVGAAFVTSFLLFHAYDYRDVIGDVEVSDFSGDVSPVDITRVRTVNQDMAKQVGEKRLGEIAGLGSRVNLGTMNIQTLNGCFTIEKPDGTNKTLCYEDELFWAGPLTHSGIFKQWGNGTTPGYILVSATDASDVVMVTGLVETEGETESETEGGTESAGARDGKNGGQTDAASNGNRRMGMASGNDASPNKLALRYLKNSYFGYNLKRHLRASGYLTTGLSGPVFEVRDDGRPFWVVARYTKRVGFLGADATGVVTVDAQTGDIHDYTLAEAPDWVDRIQPHTFIRTQLDDWGEYVKGALNWSNEDKVTTTNGISLVFGADGRAYWYTGLQSVGVDSGTVGFALVDSRTKETRWYRISGATETAAVAAAENARGVREAGYWGSNAILYNVANIPTYFTVLHGDNGLPQMYAFVNVEDYSIVGVGQTPRKALRDYQVKLSSSRSVNAEDLVGRETMQAVVAAVAVEQDGDSQTYYFLLQGHEGREFYASPSVSIELKWTRTGDRVKVIVDSGESASVNIVRFDNLEHSLEN